MILKSHCQNQSWRWSSGSRNQYWFLSMSWIWRTESGFLWSQVSFIFFQDGETFKRNFTKQTNKQLTHLPSTSQKNPSIYIWTGSDIRGRASLFPEASQDGINVLKRFVDLSSFFSSWNLTHDYRIITTSLILSTRKYTAFTKIKSSQSPPITLEKTSQNYRINIL